MAACFWLYFFAEGVSTVKGDKGGVDGLVDRGVDRAVSFITVTNGALAGKEEGGGGKGGAKDCSWIGAGELWMVELGIGRGKLGFPTEITNARQNRSGEAKWRKNKSALIC